MATKIKRKQSPAQLKNLEKGKATQFVKGDPRAKLGNPARVKALAEKRGLKARLEMLMSLQANPEILAKLKNIVPSLEGAQQNIITNEDLTALRILNEIIIKGNMQALDRYLEITGQKVVKQEIEIKEPRKFLFEIKKSK